MKTIIKRSSSKRSSRKTLSQVTDSSMGKILDNALASWLSPNPATVAAKTKRKSISKKTKQANSTRKASKGGKVSKGSKGS